jgi:hypothetical protein
LSAEALAEVGHESRSPDLDEPDEDSDQVIVAVCLLRMLTYGGSDVEFAETDVPAPTERFDDAGKVAPATTKERGGR